MALPSERPNLFTPVRSFTSFAMCLAKLIKNPSIIRYDNIRSINILKVNCNLRICEMSPLKNEATFLPLSWKES